MALNKEQKKQIVKDTINSEINTGHVQVQINILSQEVDQLNEHLKQHKLDFHSKRGFLMKKKKISKLIKYLNSKTK
ncbi:30S ribosomal protein S15 [Columbia Basin potato purple top phytoplasma]|uniref:30S ribosomal protein S15 n=1 Tax=Columbia Basin potato purple top phytoplasma TaxID=307134 RepID=A0ABT5L924_9MOLU|nr:30S ribosomal protein S15 [Columbia Basin potato purple top phytoplasma]MDC9032111.1 30S ribosomal protein S15 [Columbia Basin potato purple top phytoplasma]